MKRIIGDQSEAYNDSTRRWRSRNRSTRAHSGADNESDDASGPDSNLQALAPNSVIRSRNEGAADGPVIPKRNPRPIGYLPETLSLSLSC